MLGSVARQILRLLGWTWEGKFPTQSKGVMVVSPHTSNWDLIVAVLFKWALDVRHVNYLAKHSVFWWPLSSIMRFTGGIPVFRHEHRNVVVQVTDMFAERDRLWLAIAPAGTRRKTDYWKSGFYHMAQAAKVPILPVQMDFGRKVLRFGEPYHVIGEVAQDMDHLRSFFGGARGYRNELTTPIRLSIEDEGSVEGKDATMPQIG